MFLPEDMAYSAARNYFERPATLPRPEAKFEILGAPYVHLHIVLSQLLEVLLVYHKQSTSYDWRSAERQLKLRNTSSSIVLPCAEEEARIWKLSRRREDSCSMVYDMVDVSRKHCVQIYARASSVADRKKQRRKTVREKKQYCATHQEKLVDDVDGPPNFESEDIAMEVFNFRNYFHSKEKRRQTYTSWVFKDDVRCNADALAEAGFIYAGNEKEPDCAQCFVCKKSLDGWEPEDDPWSEHLKHQKIVHLPQHRNLN
nr:unnamed protein product [Callosobruchus chinensis]